MDLDKRGLLEVFLILAGLYLLMGALLLLPTLLLPLSEWGGTPEELERIKYYSTLQLVGLGSLGLLFTFLPGRLARLLLRNHSSSTRPSNVGSRDALKVGLILLGVFFFVSGVVNALREVQWLFMSDSTRSLVSTGVELVQFALGCCLVAFAGKLAKRLLDHNASENQ